MNKIMSTLITLLAFGLFSCTKPPQGLVSFYYGIQGTAYNSGYKYEVTLKDNHTEIVMKEEYDSETEITIVCDDSKILEELQQIATHHKMYRYKGYYKSKFEIMDGEMWYITLKYSDGTMVHASGHHAWPRGFGDALDEVRRCIMKYKDNN